MSRYSAERFSSKPYDRELLDLASQRTVNELSYFDVRLALETAALADGYRAVCAFVNDDPDAPVRERPA